MASPEASDLTENEQHAGLNADYEQRDGFHDAEHYLDNNRVWPPGERTGASPRRAAAGGD